MIREWYTGLRAIDRDALTIWLASRVSILVLAGSVGWVFAVNGERVIPFADRWVQWDFHHYQGIALLGYGGEPTGVPNEAFFPGFPMLLRAGHWVGLEPVVAGLLVSVIAGGIAAVALGRLGELEGGRALGRYAVVAWVFAPLSVFLAAPYTEALFAACAFPAWLTARRGNWMAAGLLTALACTVRVNGLFLAAALGVYWLTNRERTGWTGFGWLLAPLAPLVAWSAYLYDLTGDWLAWLHAQSEGWNREFTAPWDSWANTWNAAFGGTQRPEFAWMFRAEIVAMLVGVALTIALLTWRRWGEATWVGLHVIALGTSMWYFSVPRATLLWWPLWILIATWAMRHRWVLWGYIFISVPLMSVWAVAFLTGRWAG